MSRVTELQAARRALKEQLRQTTRSLSRQKRRRTGDTSASDSAGLDESSRKKVATAYVVSGFQADVAISVLHRVSPGQTVRPWPEKQAYVEDLFLALSNADLASCYCPVTRGDKFACPQAAEASVAAKVRRLNRKGEAPDSRRVWDFYRQELPANVEVRVLGKRSRNRWVQRFRQTWRFKRSRLQTHAELDEGEVTAKAGARERRWKLDL